MIRVNRVPNLFGTPNKTKQNTTRQDAMSSKKKKTINKSKERTVRKTPQINSHGS